MGQLLSAIQAAAFSGWRRAHPSAAFSRKSGQPHAVGKSFAGAFAERHRQQQHPVAIRDLEAKIHGIAPGGDEFGCQARNRPAGLQTGAVEIRQEQALPVRLQPAIRAQMIVVAEGLTRRPPYQAVNFTFGETRASAIAKMRRALDELVIEGVRTTAPFHKMMMEHEAFLSGNFDTQFVDTHEWLSRLPAEA